MEIFDNILKSRLQTQKARMLALEFCYFSFYLYKNALSVTNANRKKTAFQVQNKPVLSSQRVKLVTWHCWPAFFSVPSCCASLQIACSSETWDQPPSEIHISGIWVS